MGQRVLVTGSTGVLGRRVLPRLVEAGHTVTAVVRSEAKAAAARASGATPVEIDLFDRRAMWPRSSVSTPSPIWRPTSRPGRPPFDDQHGVSTIRFGGRLPRRLPARPSTQASIG